MTVKQKILKVSGLFMVMLTVGCVTASYSRALFSKNNITSMVDGQLNDARSLPPHGRGYRTHSYLGSALGRQYGHHKVIRTLEIAFANLHDSTGQTFDIAEIGSKKGGQFFPHFTHREGVSVDIMTPMKKGNEPARLKTGPFSLWGYCWHLDPKSNTLNGLKWDAPSTSKYPYMCPTITMESEMEVDFIVLRKMILELAKTAKQEGGRIEFVIVAPAFVPHLQDLGVHLSTRASLIHDDHIHVEFRF